MNVECLCLELACVPCRVHLGWDVCVWRADYVFIETRAGFSDGSVCLRWDSYFMRMKYVWDGFVSMSSGLYTVCYCKCNA